MAKAKFPKKLKPIPKKRIEELLQKGARDAAINREAVKRMSIMGADVRNMVFRSGGTK